MEIKGFKKDFKIYNLKDNNIIKIYYINFNPLKIEFKMSNIIPLNNNVLEKINEEKDFNIKKLKNIKKINFFFINLIKISNEFYINIRNKVKNNYHLY